jgi:hypothetical protein
MDNASKLTKGSVWDSLSALKGAILAFTRAFSKDKKTQTNNAEKYQVVCATANKGWQNDPQACHFHVYAPL